MLGSSLIPLNNAPIVELQAPRHHATGRMLLAKRNDSNATPHWIDEQAMSHDDDDASHRAKHFEAASRFERPASLAQVTKNYFRVKNICNRLCLVSYWKFCRVSMTTIIITIIIDNHHRHQQQQAHDVLRAMLHRCHHHRPPILVA